MSKLQCWQYIKDSCNESGLDAQAAANAQADALWYEGKIKMSLPQVDQDQIAALAADVTKASNQTRKKAEALKAFVKAKAEADPANQ